LGLRDHDPPRSKHDEHLHGIFLHAQFRLSFNPGGPTSDVPPGLRFAGATPHSSEYGSDELNDLPAGLLAWIIENRGSRADTGGDVETRFTKDDPCAALTIDWATGSCGTSARYYYEFAN
jgi:hypothetical protein